MTQSPYGALSLPIPAVVDPHRYEGLFVYDFGTHVSIGYTAGEVKILCQSEDHKKGSAYEIYRVNEQGGFELRGVLDRTLTEKEAICFLRSDPMAARRDFDAIRSTARRHPLPCSAELQLARLDSFEPSEVTALVYEAMKSTAVSKWLVLHAPNLGDTVKGGFNVFTSLTNATGERLEIAQLGGGTGAQSRSKEEVLGTTDQPLQR